MLDPEVRNFRVFAARVGLRAKVIREPAERRRGRCAPAPKQRVAELDEEALRRAVRDELGFNPLALGTPPKPEHVRRLGWASLLQRVIRVDVCDLKSQTGWVAASRHFQLRVLKCPCGGRRKVAPFIPSGELAREILEKLGVDATEPPVAKVRARPRQEHFDLHPVELGVDPQYTD